MSGYEVLKKNARATVQIELHEAHEAHEKIKRLEAVIDKLPRVVADRLMTTGNGDVAERLVLELPGGRTVGGHCRQSVVDTVRDVNEFLLAHGFTPE